MIYIAGIGTTGLVKIGCTHQPIRDRLMILQAVTGHCVELLGIVEGSYAKEKEIHGQFSHLRVGRGEYFELDTGLKRFLNRHGVNTTRVRQWQAKAKPGGK